VYGRHPRLFTAAHHFGNHQRRQDADDGDDQQHFDEGEGATQSFAGGASSTSPQNYARLVSQGLAELASPKVLDFNFHKFCGFI
jgi:hypothetical protein